MCLYVCVYIIYPRCAQPRLLYRDIYTSTHFSSSCGSLLSCRLTAVIPGAVSLVLALSCLPPLLLFSLSCRLLLLTGSLGTRYPLPCPSRGRHGDAQWHCPCFACLIFPILVSCWERAALLPGGGSGGFWPRQAGWPGGEELTGVPCPLGRSRGSH